jgi:hypothetical protein
MDFDCSLHFLAGLLHSDGIELWDATIILDCAHLVFFHNWRGMGRFGRRDLRRFRFEEALGSARPAMGQYCICPLVLDR